MHYGWIIYRLSNLPRRKWVRTNFIYNGDNWHSRSKINRGIILYFSEQRAPRKKHFFSPNTPYSPLPYANKRGKLRTPGSKDLRSVIKCADKNFIDFL